jgi:signal transduction histidine kinase
VHAARQDRDRAQLAAARDAHELAGALRAFLRRREVLELVGTPHRVTVRDGGVVVDPEVGWLAQNPPAAADAVLDERLRRAQLAEFVAGDAAAARACFDELLTARVDDAAVLAAAAWQAHRAGDAPRAAALQQRLVDTLAPLRPTALAAPEVAAGVASAALLLAALGIGLPASLEPLVTALPLPLGTAVLARCAAGRSRCGNGAGGADATAGTEHPLRSRLAAVDARRAVLAAVQARVRALPEHAAALVLGGAEPRALLWFPDGSAGSGSAALVDGDWLASLPGLGTARAPAAPELPPLPDRGLVVVGASPPADAGEVIPGMVAVEPLPPPPLPFAYRPAVIAAAAALLVAVFAASAFAVLRAFRREAAALRARSDFLTGVTHELKTPVAAIRLVADVLHDDDVPPARQREYFALLAGETARLAALVDNVLDVGQIERGERAYDLRPCDLGDVVRDAMRAFEPLAQRAGIALAVQAAPGAAPAVADAGALQQALFAVCENARKYAAEGGRLDVAAARDGDAFAIALRDFGPGVPVDERDAIFARFARGTAQRSGTVPGVGLGLYLARRIVQRHGGTLSCRAPAEGPGAVFVFTLPLAAATTTSDPRRA